MLLLVGDGELHQPIVNKIQELGLEEKVILVGQVSHPELYYSLTDVMVFPSVFEGLPLVVIESQIVGVPTVVSEAIPKEAIISNGVERLKLSDDDWANIVLKIADRKVRLNEKSKEYNIGYAVKKLQEWYVNKIKDLN